VVRPGLIIPGSINWLWNLRPLEATPVLNLPEDLPNLLALPMVGGIDNARADVPPYGLLPTCSKAMTPGNGNLLGPHQLPYVLKDVVGILLEEARPDNFPELVMRPLEVLNLKGVIELADDPKTPFELLRVQLRLLRRLCRCL